MYFYISKLFTIVFLIQIFIVDYVINNILTPVKRQHQKGNLSTQLFNAFFNKKTFKVLYWWIQLLPFGILSIIILSLNIWETIIINWNNDDQVFNWALDLSLFIAMFACLIYAFCSLYISKNKLKKQYKINKVKYKELLNKINNFILDSNTKNVIKTKKKLEKKVAQLNKKDLINLSNIKTIKSFQNILYLIIKGMDDFELENGMFDKQKIIMQAWSNINAKFLGCVIMQ